MPKMENLMVLTSHTNSDKNTIIVYMSYLTQEEENILDNEDSIEITRNDITYNIEKRNVLGYGNIDFSEDSVDVKLLRHYNNLLYNRMPGKLIPVFNFNTMNIKTRKGIIQRTETWDFSELCKYGYCTLNKPNKVIIFKETK